MDPNVIRTTDTVALEILNSVGVRDRLLVAITEIKHGSLYLVNGRMLLALMYLPNGAVEAHIAESKDNWKHIHNDINESLIFIQGLGYNRIYTNVNQKLKMTLNLLNKHGFEAIGIKDNEVILLWE